MEQRGLRTVGRFFEALADGPTTGVLYRGHANATWPLVPSAFRPGKRGIDSPEKLHRWVRAAARFATPLPRNDVEWLVLAQHYGVPTPLLDWSTSPLVGLFFACIGEAQEPGCVWQVRTAAAFREFNYPETVNPFRMERERPGLVFATAMNARTLAQDSAMSLHCDARDTIPAALMRAVYTVQSEEKPDTIKALATLGFTEERLFWDIGVVVQRFVAELAADDLR